MANWPILVLILLIVALFTSSAGMPTICGIGALAILVFSGVHDSDLLAHVAPIAANVLVIMGVTQLAIQHMLRGGIGERVSICIATLATHRLAYRIPASILLPGIFIPATMILAMFMHNIGAIAILTCLCIDLSRRYHTTPTPTLCAMLIASNLGGASWATGDTPAVIQRQYWGFTPAQFAVAMLPRNLIVLLVLTLFACFVAWLSDKCRKTDWSDTLKRLKARDDIRRQSRYQMANSKDAWIGTLALSAFIFLQFVFPKLSLATGSLVFVALVLLTPSDKRTKAFFALGLDATLVITSLFIVAGAVEQTPFVADLAEWLGQHRIPGLIEIAAYVLTIAISADGAAATLAPLVHSFSGGTMISAWQLASGICSGSSSLLTSASAGPVLNSISKQANCELTYRKYAGFGLAFSFVMLVIYLAINFIVR